MDMFWKLATTQPYMLADYQRKKLQSKAERMTELLKQHGPKARQLPEFGAALSDFRRTADAYDPVLRRFIKMGKREPHLYSDGNFTAAVNEREAGLFQHLGYPDPLGD